MRLVRFAVGGQVRYGVVEGETVRELLRPFFENIVPMGTTHRLADLDLLAPTRPTKMVCVGVNYRDHADEMSHVMPDEPILFLKPPSALLGPGRPILCPRNAGRVDYEAELAIVIGRRCRNVPPEKADRVILGYTCFNDVTARDLQRKDGQWARAKGFDTFGVAGPWIETDPGDPADLAVECRLNGQVRQRSRTSCLAFGCLDLVARVSRVMTLEAGDLIATGTPSGIGPMTPGDRVEVRIEGIGTLANEVADEPEGRLRPAEIL